MNEKIRRAYHSQQLRVMAKLEGSLFRQLKPIINRQYMEVAKMITHGVRDTDYIIDQQSLRIRKVLNKHYYRTINTAGRSAMLLFEQKKTMSESFWNEMNDFVARWTGRQVQKVQGTTKKAVRKVVSKGIEEGETNREIATRLRKVGQIDSNFRAIRIARTETLGAYNASTDASVRDTGLKFKRIWSTTKDMRTRRRKEKSIYDHWVVDGQERKQNEPFDVYPDQLMYPGDQEHGSAGNIVNCRCLLMYERDRDRQTVEKPTLDIVSSVISDEFPTSTGQMIQDSKPMSSIGRFSNCVLDSKKFIKAPGLDPCIDITRSIEGETTKWYLKGKEITDKDVLTRLNKMGLPPAWKNVVVSTDPLKKVQAIGMDKAGRWQYRYSEQHVLEAAQKKFNRQKLFSKDISKIRESYQLGINDEDPRAYLLSLEDRTAIRAGSRTDFKAKKKAYGLTTLQHEHLTIKKDRIILDFVAKEGIPAHYELTDKKLANWLLERKNKTKPGDMLFPDVPANKLNEYIKQISEKNYTIKDFRTYHGTRIAYEELEQYGGQKLLKKEKEKIIKNVSEKVSGFLHNTPSMAKKSYINPMVWDFVGGL